MSYMPHSFAPFMRTIEDLRQRTNAWAADRQPGAGNIPINAVKEVTQIASDPTTPLILGAMLAANLNPYTRALVQGLGAGAGLGYMSGGVAGEVQEGTPWRQGLAHMLQRNPLLALGMAASYKGPVATTVDNLSHMAQTSRLAQGVDAATIGPVRPSPLGDAIRRGTFPVLAGAAFGNPDAAVAGAGIPGLMPLFREYPELPLQIRDIPYRISPNNPAPAVWMAQRFIEEVKNDLPDQFRRNENIVRNMLPNPPNVLLGKTMLNNTHLRPDIASNRQLARIKYGGLARQQYGGSFTGPTEFVSPTNQAMVLGDHSPGRVTPYINLGAGLGDANAGAWFDRTLGHEFFGHGLDWAIRRPVQHRGPWTPSPSDPSYVLLPDEIRADEAGMSFMAHSSWPDASRVELFDGMRRQNKYARTVLDAMNRAQWEPQITQDEFKLRILQGLSGHPISRTPGYQSYADLFGLR